MNNSIRDLTRYFKKSLIDEERLGPDSKDVLSVLGDNKPQDPTSEYIAVGNLAWFTGRIDATLASKIIESKQPKDDPPIHEIELILFPRVDLSIYEYGWTTSFKRKALLPLVLFVNLKEDGQLAPNGKGPWIPREWQSPNQSDTKTFCEYGVVDNFLTSEPFEGIEDWPQVVEYCTSFLKAACEQSEMVESSSLYDINIHPEYRATKQCLIRTEKQVTGAAKKIVDVLDVLLETQSWPQLYQAFCSRESPEIHRNQDLQYSRSLAKRHVGQMTGEFPLSPKQRNALYHNLKQETGEILAVNGPPGTGKTTLLRSVVANLWTQAALDESEPPLIIATSNNNQAVTNILENFATVNEEGVDKSLAGRWIPEVSSYGLFCCSTSKVGDQNPYMYLGPRNEGCMQHMQGNDFFARASQYFLRQCSRHFSFSLILVKDAKELLHQEIKDTQDLIFEGIDSLSELKKIERSIHVNHGTTHLLFTKIADQKKLLEASQSIVDTTTSVLGKLYSLWDNRSFLQRFLMWLPFVKRRACKQNAKLLNSWGHYLNNYSDLSVKLWLTNKLVAQLDELKAIEHNIANLQGMQEEYEKARKRLDHWISIHRPASLLAKSISDQVNEINDRVLRFKLFKLATHYWEARWLIELKDFLDSKDSDKKSPHKLLRKFRRIAKLTPCFVSTFYMLPSFFTAYEKRDRVWKCKPLFDKIDLLIVDEAGQALPHISSACFALAKQALIVGDTDQIEPVWRVPASVDRANLLLFDLFSCEEEYDDFWLKSGLLASSGNLMKVAQRECRYHQFKKLQRGLYLTEHRRCYDSIINYCNVLVYEGILEPLRGTAKDPVPWGTLSFIPIAEESQTYGGSRGNLGEAQRIAEWLTAERDKIIRYAKHKHPDWSRDYDDEKILRMAVGIVTPFRKQAHFIKEKLGDEGIQGLTIGTVHSLQGDERLIVIFSSVYGRSDYNLTKFYDRGPNMLNVAVSRAKDAFIVFGDPGSFGAENPESPSGLLRSMLRLQERPSL